MYNWGYATSLNPLFGGSAFRTALDENFDRLIGLNPLFGGSAFRTPTPSDLLTYAVLIPFLAGLLFGHYAQPTVH